MTNKRGKISFVAGFLLGALAFGSIGAFARNTITRPLTATFADIRLYIDGQRITPADANGNTVEPFIVDGTTYLPVRAVAEAFGKDVEWDGDAYAVYIGARTTEQTPAPATTPTPTQTPGEIPDYSQAANPAIFGEDGFYYYMRPSERILYNRRRHDLLDLIASPEQHAVHPNLQSGVAEADKFIASLTGLSDYDKLGKINEYLCAHMTYKKNKYSLAPDDFWSGQMYGVCNSYATMVDYMCLRAGLPCIMITGDVKGNSNPGKHAWNNVYIDGNWQYYDGTFSDGVGRFLFGTIDSKYTYTDERPKWTMWDKEVYVPGSTL
jgi:hypothetical protein